MGIFDWLSGKRKQNKKEKTSELTDYQKHWLGLVDEYVKQEDFDFIKTTYTIDSLGEEHFELLLSEDDEHGVTKDERKEGVQSRVDGLLSIRDYINTNGSEEQKFHYESSLKGAKLYASSLEVQAKLDQLDFEFEEIMAIIDLHVGLEIVIREFENYTEKFKENKELTESVRIELKNRFSVIEGEKNLKKQEKLFKEYVDIISSFPTLLMDLLNDFAYNQFEQAKYKEGLNLSAQSISLLKLAFNEDMESQKQKLASYLDTFSYGLYLYGQFKDAVKISDISISLSPDDDYISEHLTNRGKSKLKLNDIEGAKLDFQKALDKDKDFEEAKSLLESINK